MQLSPIEIIKILLHKLFNAEFAELSQTRVSILWTRLPRVLLSFVVGSALSVSGVVMQSVLRNPLASSYTLGVSSGAAVGASLTLLFSLSFLGLFTLPFFGLLGGLVTVFAAILLASKIDKNMGNTTIILTGMALSLFANAAITFILSMMPEKKITTLIHWQMGTLSDQGWTPLAIIAGATVVITALLFIFHKEMDVMSFGEEYAKAAGVSVTRIKWILLSLSAAITGIAIAFVGIVGFIDLFTPHVARKIFGSKHIFVIPAAALIGGFFTTICDLISRAAFKDIQFPIGAVTAIIGAPFFIYIYFSGRKKGA